MTIKTTKILELQRFLELWQPSMMGLTTNNLIQVLQYSDFEVQQHKTACAAAYIHTHTYRFANLCLMWEIQG